VPAAFWKAMGERIGTAAVAEVVDRAIETGIKTLPNLLWIFRSESSALS